LLIFDTTLILIAQKQAVNLEGLDRIIANLAQPTKLEVKPTENAAKPEAPKADAPKTAEQKPAVVAPAQAPQPTVNPAATPQQQAPQPAVVAPVKAPVAAQPTVVTPAPAAQTATRVPGARNRKSAANPAATKPVASAAVTAEESSLNDALIDGYMKEHPECKDRSMALINAIGDQEKAIVEAHKQAPQAAQPAVVEPAQAPAAAQQAPAPTAQTAAQPAARKKVARKATDQPAPAAQPAVVVDQAPAAAATAATPDLDVNQYMIEFQMSHPNATQQDIENYRKFITAK